MHNWEYNISDSSRPSYLNLVLFTVSVSLAVLMFLIFHPEIEELNQESLILINMMFVPAIAIGFLYGMRITERAMQPSEIHSRLKRFMIKTFLFFFVIGGLFSSVNFALNGGSVIPETTVFDVGLLSWLNNFVIANGGVTFLIISSIILMTAATKRITVNSGFSNKIIAFVGTFAFFSMLALSFTNDGHTNSSVFLYAFFHVGIIGGIFFAMSRTTNNFNTMNDFADGY